MAAEGDETQTGEIEFKGPAGVGLRTKGYRLMDIAWLILGAAIIFGAWELRAHAGDSSAQSAAIVKSITEANSAIVQALKEQQAVAKESNVETVRALQRLTRTKSEANCLLDPLMRNRPDAREFCKRVSGRDDR